MKMRTADEWFEAYGVSHQNKINKAIHWICVPTIVFSLLGMLWGVKIPGLAHVTWLNLASVVAALGLLFYFRLSFSLGVGMLLFSVAALLGLRWLALQGWAPLWQISLGLFVVAWVGQFLGHHIEGEKPSFLEDLQFLLIGPVWLLGFLYRRFGIAY